MLALLHGKGIQIGLLSWFGRFAAERKRSIHQAHWGGRAALPYL